MHRSEPIRARDARKPVTKFYGLQACLAIFAKRPAAIQRVFLIEAHKVVLKKLMEWCKSRRVLFKIVPSDEISKVAATEHHEGVCIEADPLVPLTLDAFEDLMLARGAGSVLYLEQVENPHNIGAILRTAGFFGIDGVVLQSATVRTLSGALCRVAEGAAEHLPITIVESPKEILPRLTGHGFVPVATSPHEGRSLYTFAWPERVVVMLGAEGAGLSEGLVKKSGVTVTIPRFGPMESLNVAASLSAMLVEMRRGTLFGGKPARGSEKA